MAIGVNMLRLRRTSESQPRAPEERESGPQCEGRSQDELQPVRVEPEVREHFQRDNRDGQRDADPQAPAHVGEFRIGLRFGADGQRLLRP